jgi:hypothetical protein
MRPSDYERQPAPEFLFERRPLRRRPPVAPQPGEAILVAGNQPAHRVTRHEERVITRCDAPLLTVTSDPNNSIAVVAGNRPDWKLSFWAKVAAKQRPKQRRGREQSEDRRSRVRGHRSGLGSSVRSAAGPCGIQHAFERNRRQSRPVRAAESIAKISVDELCPDLCPPLARGVDETRRIILAAVAGKCARFRLEREGALLPAALRRSGVSPSIRTPGSQTSLVATT